MFYIYDFNGVLLFKKGFDTYQQAFDFCLDKFKFDEEMDEIIIKEKGEVEWKAF